MAVLQRKLYSVTAACLLLLTVYHKHFAARVFFSSSAMAANDRIATVARAGVFELNPFFLDHPLHAGDVVLLESGDCRDLKATLRSDIADDTTAQTNPAIFMRGHGIVVAGFDFPPTNWFEPDGQGPAAPRMNL